MLLRMMLLIVMSWVINVSAMRMSFDSYNLEKEFIKVAMSLGFDIKILCFPLYSILSSRLLQIFLLKVKKALNYLRIIIIS